MSLVVLDLDTDGNPLDPATDRPVADVRGFLSRHLEVPDSATDIVVFVHGWQNTRPRALDRAQRFVDLVTGTYDATRYPGLGAWNSHYVVVRWPSASNPFLHGYRRIRDRAHLMSTTGRAPDVLAHLLGYLNTHRERPRGTLRTKAGQYLHLVGHSFGCRFIAEAIQWAADSRPDVLGWDRADPRYPYAADTLLLLQMAHPHDLIAQRFPRLVHDAPINGPAVFTHSRADRALGLWHRLAEGRPGIGHLGVTQPAEHITSTKLRPIADTYAAEDFPTALVNIDANLHFRRGRFLNPAGAHADVLHPESAHLLLSLAELAR